MTSCILLSAGFNQRFGSPKALAIFQEKFLIEHIQDVLIQSQVNEIIVVLGAYCDEIKPHIVRHPKIKFTINKDYQSGQTSSFKAGLSNIALNSLSIMVLPIDYPFIKGETFNSLVDYFLQHKPRILIPTYQDRKGHPPLFSIDLKPKFLKLNNSVGINSMAQRMSSDIILLPIQDPAVVSTFNTPVEFEERKKEFQSR